MQPLCLALFAGVVAGASNAIRSPLHLPVRPRQTGNTCCFGLRSVGIVDEQVEENHFGALSLGGPFQQGGFCFDKLTKTIKDTLNHNCFMRAPTEQFQCYVGIVGATAFDISPPGSDGKSYLTYDGSPGSFFACPVGSGADQYYNIFSALKPETTGCVSVALSLYDTSADCFPASNATMTTPTSNSSQSMPSRWTTLIRQSQSTASTMTSFSSSQVLSAEVWSSTLPTASASARSDPGSKTSSAAATHTARPSQTCSVSQSAPSIAPIKLGSPDKSTLDGIRDSSAEVSVTSHNSTVLLYTIPNSFLPPVSDANVPLCALQFRMPVCTELPKGYPCYSFSGLEQEFLANSGMNFDLILDDGQAVWNGTALHQVVPGETTILGTFECGKPKGSYGARTMSWRVSSVRNFSLEFLHAGVGNGTKFQDGIGAWIVSCE
jgi:hypothetical protein